MSMSTGIITDMNTNIITSTSIITTTKRKATAAWSRS